VLDKSGANAIMAKFVLRPRGLIGWIIARIRSTSGTQSRAPREMHLVEKLTLGGKRQLMLVECGGERFLVGCGTDTVESIIQIRAIHEM
jgi:flagellar biogenesis protein FliO